MTKTIDVQPDDEGSLHEKLVSFLIDDLKRLRDIVRNENSRALSPSGRVKALAVIPEIDIKGDISDNMTDLIHRKKVFVANNYQKAPVKSSSVMSLKHLRTPLLFYFQPVLYSLYLGYQTTWLERWVVS